MDEKELMIKVGDDGIFGHRKRVLKMKQIDCCCCDFDRYLKVIGDEG